MRSRSPSFLWIRAFSILLSQPFRFSFVQSTQYFEMPWLDSAKKTKSVYEY
jgi:hypothetical protein